MVWYLPGLKSELQGIGDRVYGTLAKFLLCHFYQLYESSADSHSMVSVLSRMMTLIPHA